MELLTEYLSGKESGLITEAATVGKDMYLCGIFMQSGIKNGNGRIYDAGEMLVEVDKANIKIKETRGIVGELDHPEGLLINLDRVSHTITELLVDGNNVYGKAKLIDTPMGLIAKELSKAGVMLGVSSRGAGNVLDGGVVESFNFITVDIVATPSCAAAVPESVYETLDMSKKGKNIMSLAEHVREDVSAQKYFKAAIMKFINDGSFVKR